MLSQSSNVLPNELIFHVASFLDFKSLYKFSETCAYNRDLVTNNLFESNYFVHQILRKEFSKPQLSNDMCNFLNNITDNKKGKWLYMIGSLYNRNIFPQRQVMLKRYNYDFLLDAIITDNRVAISYLFGTYRLYDVPLDQIFDRLRYHDRLDDITNIVTYANILLINIVEKTYNTTTNITDIWLNIFSLPYLLQKNDIEKSIIDIAKKRNAYINNIVFIIWFETGYINKGIY